MRTRSPSADKVDPVCEITDALVRGTEEPSMHHPDPWHAVRHVAYGTAATRLSLLSDR